MQQVRPADFSIPLSVLSSFVILLTHDADVVSNVKGNPNSADSRPGGCKSSAVQVKQSINHGAHGAVAQ